VLEVICSGRQDREQKVAGEAKTDTKVGRGTTIKRVGKSKRVLPYNDQAMDAAGPLNGKQTEYRIEGERGLVLIVTSEGTGTYYFRYTIGHGLKRKFRTEKIGRRDEVTLHDARQRASQLRRAVGRGADPVAEGDAGYSAITLRELFAERLEQDDSKARRTLEDYQRTLEADVFPAIGDLQAGEIIGEQLARVLENIDARSKHAAHKARSAIGSTYRWAVKHRKLKANPTIGLGFTVQSKPRNRVLGAKELATLWSAIDSGPGLSEAMRIILKLAVLTGQRESEVAGALASELTLDTANPRWRIPSERMKRKNREQIVPLTTQAVALFKRAIELSNGSAYVFPADMSRARIGTETRTPHIHGESVSRAMARLRERVGLHDARVHDLRKTVTTWLREDKLVSSDVCDLILHHARKGVTARHFDFSTLEGPVRAALQMWADYVWQITQQAVSVTNVVPMARA
jgi:integrase